MNKNLSINIFIHNYTRDMNADKLILICQLICDQKLITSKMCELKKP